MKDYAYHKDYGNCEKCKHGEKGLIEEPCCFCEMNPNISGDYWQPKKKARVKK